MEDIIKRLLREAFNKLSVGHNPELNEFETKLYDEGKKFYPKLQFKTMKDKYNGKVTVRAFTNYASNKGSYSMGSFKSAIINFKIRSVIKWLNPTDINYSNSTNSVYFTYNGQNIRISDHKKNSFNGKNIILNWFTTSQEIADQFN